MVHVEVWLLPKQIQQLKKLAHIQLLQHLPHSFFYRVKSRQNLYKVALAINLVARVVKS